MYELVWTQHTGGHASNSTVGGKSREMFWTTHCSDDAFPRDCTVHVCDLWNAKCFLATCLITVVDLSTHTNGDVCLLPANSAVFKTLWIVDWWLWYIVVVIPCIDLYWGFSQSMMGKRLLCNGFPKSPSLSKAPSVSKVRWRSRDMSWMSRFFQRGIWRSNPMSHCFRYLVNYRVL